MTGVRQVGSVVSVSAEQAADALALPAFADLAAMYEAEPPEERAERHARVERDRAARTCPHCGCDPAEHGL